MENNFKIEKKVREDLVGLVRTIRIDGGILMIIIGLIVIIGTKFSTQNNLNIFAICIVIIGIFNIIYGKIGKELFRTRYSLLMDDKIIKLKRSLETHTVKLEKITAIKINPFEIVFTMNDYVKTYTFTWMNDVEFRILTDKIIDFCTKKNVDVEIVKY